ncbi:hypothetical protein GGX14DRAFT_578775 [Mycena pura]|uniref:Uncharacterized protein n=1 Tax=Mycena pura TaxID=153505 RepID=A0AAD6UPA1_9AGAR|nr:hypothetical protein GGX14DRAFT_578775 [Mycena pura]
MMPNSPPAIMALLFTLPVTVSYALAVRAPEAFLVQYVIPADNMSPVWALNVDHVLMDVHNSANYALNGSEADAQWAALIPPSGGLVHIGAERTPVMISMFHQLKCLDIIRKDYITGSMGLRTEPSPATQHCINYLRQTLLCRVDKRLESVVDLFATHSVDFRGTKTCRDWTTIYERIAEMEESAIEAGGL